MVRETEVRTPCARYIRQKMKRSSNFVSCESLDTVESHATLQSSKLMLLDSHQASYIP